jgi:hypothetical protein
MTLKTQSNTRVMTIDDDNHRLVFDRVDNEVRVFEHVPFSTLIEILKGEMK